MRKFFLAALFCLCSSSCVSQPQTEPSKIIAGFDTEQERQLVRAILDGDSTSFDVLISEGSINLTAVSATNATPLKVSVWADNLRAFEVLSQKGALRATSREQLFDIILFCANYRDTSYFSVMRKEGVDIDWTPEGRKAPILDALFQRVSIKQFQKLLGLGFSLSGEIGFGYFSAAMTLGLWDHGRLLLEAGVDLNTRPQRFKDRLFDDIKKVSSRQLDPEIRSQMDQLTDYLAQHYGY